MTAVQILQQTEQNTDASTDEDGMVTVPDLVGKTEDEATALLEEEKLGKQMMGEESSTQEKGQHFFSGYSGRNKSRTVYNSEILYQ